jgi:hypothetical protein
MRRARLVLLSCVLGALVAVLATVRAPTPPPPAETTRTHLPLDWPVLSGAAVGDESPHPVVASAAPGQADHDAALVLDGRRIPCTGDAVPHAYRPTVGRVSVALRFDPPRALSGLVLSWEGHPAADGAVRVGNLRIPVPPAGADGESVLWWGEDIGEPITELSVEFSVRDAASGLAEVAFLARDAEVWLVSPRTRADWDMEILATYGMPWVARAPDTADLGRFLRHARVVAVSNAALSRAGIEALRAFARAGGTLVELGPAPAICGPPDLDRTNAEPADFVLGGDVGEDARWVEPIARVTACDRRECTDERVRVSERARGGAESTSLPLAVTSTFGRGTCTRWLGDLSAAIRSSRQGDPARAGERAAGETHAKAADLFANRLTGPDYDVPSADRLGFALIAQLADARGPDLIVSPLPGGAPGLLVFTADQDFVPGPGVLAHSEAASGAGMTLTLTAADIGGKPDVVYPESDRGLVAPEIAQAIAARGHGLGLHPNLVGVAPALYAHVLSDHAAAFTQRFGVAPRVVRNHHVIWSGYVDMAILQARAGLRMNLDYVSVPRATNFRPGFMTGSGLPMRFSDRNGALVPIFQQATQIDDLALTTVGARDRADVLRRLSARADELLDISAREHVAITVLHHSQWWYETQGAWQKSMFVRARTLGLPVWGAAQWLNFTTARRATLLRRAADGWRGHAFAEGTTLLVEGARAVRLDGVRVEAVREMTLGGRRYSVLPPLAKGPFGVEPLLDAGD